MACNDFGAGKEQLAKRLILLIRGESKRFKFNLGRLKISLGECNGFLGIKIFARVNNTGEEFFGRPNIQANARINKRDESIVALILLLAHSRWRKNNGIAVGS